MKNFILFAILLATFASCQDNYIDTGIANGKLDCTMWEYMETDSYNWDSTRLVIDRAGLKDRFDGTSSEQITFFGPANHNIRKWMNDNGYKAVSEIPADVCREHMIKYIVPRKYMKSDFDFEVKGTAEGGTIVTKADDQQVRVFRRKTDWGVAKDQGPVELYVQSYRYGATIMIASADIETTTGVVHSLSYTHSFGNF